MVVRPPPFRRAASALHPPYPVGVVATAPRPSSVWSGLLARCRLHVCFAAPGTLRPSSAGATYARVVAVLLPSLALRACSVAAPSVGRASRLLPPSPPPVGRAPSSLRSSSGTAVSPGSLRRRCADAPLLLRSPGLSFCALRARLRLPILRRSLRSLRCGGTHRSDGCPLAARALRALRSLSLRVRSAIATLPLPPP